MSLLGLGQIVGSATGAVPGAGGFTASSGASASQETANYVSSGGISIGGLTMAPKSVIDADLIMKVGVIGAMVLGGMFFLRKIKK